MNIVFVIVLLILVFSAINGWRKGLLGMIYGLISWVCILIFIIWASPYIDQYLRERTSLPETIQQKTEQSVNDKINQLSEGAKDGQEQIWNNLLEELPEPLREGIQEAIPQTETSAESVADTTVSQMIAEKFADLMIRGIAVLIAFVIAQLVVWFVGNVINTVGEAPVVSGINGFLGFATGVVQGFLYVWILMYLVTLTSANEISQQIIAYIHQNPFVTYLYQHNIVMAVIEMF